MTLLLLLVGLRFGLGIADADDAGAVFVVVVFVVRGGCMHAHVVNMLVVIMSVYL